jgi:hypothetical protein
VNIKEVVKTVAGVRLIPAPHKVARERKHAAAGYELRVAVRAPYMMFFFQIAWISFLRANIANER